MISTSRRMVAGVSPGRPMMKPAYVTMPASFQAWNILRYSVMRFWFFFM
jgi:hypothetical protein